jgi:hypothetical protein
MQPGSQRETSELNTISDDPSGDISLWLGWSGIQHKYLERACVSGAFNGLPAMSDAFVTKLITHVSGDVEGLP